MKTALAIGIVAVIAVPTIATIADRKKAEPQTAPAQLAQAEPAAPVKAAEVRQPGALTATFVAGGPDVNGQSFPLNPIAPSSGETAAWAGSFTCAAGPVVVRFGVGLGGIRWTAGTNNTTHRPDLIPVPSGKIPGAVNWWLYSRDMHLLSFGTFTVS